MSILWIIRNISCVSVSLSSSEWSTVSIEEQRRLERVRREDGEFWWVTLWHGSLQILTLKVLLLQTESRKHSYLSVRDRNHKANKPYTSCTLTYFYLWFKKKMRRGNKQAVTDGGTESHKHSRHYAAQCWLNKLTVSVVSFLHLIIWKDS